MADDPTPDYSAVVSQYLASTNCTYSQFEQWAKTHVQIDAWSQLRGNDSLLHLLYYAAFDADTDSPWSNVDMDLFKTAERARNCTQIWLKISMGAVISLPLIFWTAVEQGKMNTMTAVTVQSIVNGVLIMVAAGSNPDVKGDLARLQQEKLQEMKNKVQAMTVRLFRLEETHPKLASGLALRVRANIGAIESALQKGLGYSVAWNLTLLKDVCGKIAPPPPRPSRGALLPPGRDERRPAGAISQSASAAAGASSLAAIVPVEEHL